MNNIEIERKFLVEGDFISHSTGSVEIVQGYLSANPESTVRVRLKGDKAFLTIKGPTDSKGFACAEFEYRIPTSDAREMLALCGNKIEKRRYFVPSGKHTFEVDVFNGAHKGLIIAEIELGNENETFDRPNWLGKEVTGDIRYYNSWLAQH